MKILTDFEKIQYMRLNMKYAHYDAYKDISANIINELNKRSKNYENTNKH